MMLAVLPRRQADDVAGELFVAAYEQALWRFPNDAIEMLTREAIRTHKWFPTVADCLEILGEWRRDDEHTRRKDLAGRLANRERNLRRGEAPKIPPIMADLTQRDVEEMSPEIIKIGLSCGALVHDPDGNVIPAQS